MMTCPGVKKTPGHQKKETIGNIDMGKASFNLGIIDHWKGISSFTYILWRLILCVNQAKGCPDIWLNIILGVSARVFLDEITSESVDWASRLPSQGWALSNSWKAWIERKGGVRENLLSLPVFKLEHQSSPAFGLRLRLQLTALALLVSSLLTVNFSNFSASLIAWANSLW